MNTTKSIFTLAWMCFAATNSPAQSTNKPVFIGNFDGRTPCQEIARQLNETTTPECWKIKWRLKLYSNGGDTNAGTFSLEGFNFRKENILKGTWQMSMGTKADPNAMVYALNNTAKGNIYFLKAGDDVLLFLDNEKNILIGNNNFSYALYRANEE